MNRSKVIDLSTTVEEVGFIETVGLISIALLPWFLLGTALGISIFFGILSVTRA